jgi:hypothetical protein
MGKNSGFKEFGQTMKINQFSWILLIWRAPITISTSGSAGKSLSLGIERRRYGKTAAFQQGCQIFPTSMYQNGDEYTILSLNYQMIVKYTSCQYYILKVHIIYEPFPIQGPPKFTQIMIFLFWKYTIWQPCILVRWRQTWFAATK